MRVLITGGTGFIGSVIGEELVQAGHEVIMLDNLTSFHPSVVPPDDVTFIQGDISDADLIERVFFNPQRY